MQKLKFIAIFSTNIDAVAYLHDQKMLFIKFKNGTIYQYENVPQGTFDELMRSNSKGTYANKNIYKTYKYSKITE